MPADLELGFRFLSDARGALEHASPESLEVHEIFEVIERYQPWRIEKALERDKKDIVVVNTHHPMDSTALTNLAVPGRDASAIIEFPRFYACYGIKVVLDPTGSSPRQGHVTVRDIFGLACRGVRRTSETVAKGTGL